MVSPGFRNRSGDRWRFEAIGCTLDIPFPRFRDLSGIGAIPIQSTKSRRDVNGTVIKTLRDLNHRTNFCFVYSL